MKHNKQTDKYKYKSMTISVSWVGQWTIGQAVFYEEYVFVYINIIIIIFYIIWFSNSNMPWNWAVRWWGHKLQSHYYSASSPLIALQMCTYWRWWRRMKIMMTTIWMMMMMKCSVFMWIRNNQYRPTSTFLRLTPCNKFGSLLWDKIWILFSSMLGQQSITKKCQTGCFYRMIEKLGPMGPYTFIMLLINVTKKWSQKFL